MSRSENKNTQQSFPKLYKYMAPFHNINYVDSKFQNKSLQKDKFYHSSWSEGKADKFINVVDYPVNLAYTYESWYENGTSDYIYYPYNYKFGVPDSKYHDNFGGFMN